MPNTSEDLIAALHRQPLLVVLRADEPKTLGPEIGKLADLGVRHLELAWSPHPQWGKQCAQLRLDYPQVCFGAASVVSPNALASVVAAGLAFAVSPVLDPALLVQARALGLALVPGVLTPSEVHLARSLGCALVKLFPAAALGPGYWRSLAGPLGPMPFCIAAGGLGPGDLQQWLSCGVDAVAIGGSLSGDQAWRQLADWLASRSD